MTATTSDEDRVNPGGVQRRPVLWVALATVLVTALGVGVAWELMRTHARVPSATRLAGRFGAPPSDMNAVEMSLLSRGIPISRNQSAPRADRSDRGRETVQSFALRDPRAAAGTRHVEDVSAISAETTTPAQRLSSYGWTDREGRRVHIPLARAIELYLAREGTGRRLPGPAEPRGALSPPATTSRGAQ